MKNMRQLLIAGLLATSAFAQTNLGIFTNSGDVGAPAKKGSAEFNAANGQYKITGGGANMWGKVDEAQFLWKEVPGNFSVTATIEFLGKGADHRKAGIMVRQTLDTDSAYADFVIHGNGMPGLQWRSTKGEDTNTFDFPFDGPGKVKIKFVRTGVRMFAYVAKAGGEYKELAHTEVSLRNPVMVGLVVCSHDANVSDTVVFSDVVLEEIAPPAPRKQ
jgi:regulation of enolase protein 1 (concanavalin A-like superfamily)